MERLTHDDQPATVLHGWPCNGWAERIHTAERDGHGSGGSAPHSRLSAGCAGYGRVPLCLCAGAPARRGDATDTLRPIVSKDAPQVVGFSMRRVLGRHSRSFSFLEALVATGLIAGCGLSARNTIPSEFILQAEPGVTLTALTTHPELYQGKVVIVGGVPLAEIREGDRVWIELRNRPLEANYVPHRPLSRRTRGRTLLGTSPIPRLPSDLAHVGASDGRGASARPSPFSTATGHG